jgi:lysine biosynthesis protein LysW
MPTAFCPECDNSIRFDTSPTKNDHVTCIKCGAYLKVIGLSPIELDWVDEEDEVIYDFDEDYDLDDDDF